MGVLKTQRPSVRKHAPPELQAHSDIWKPKLGRKPVGKGKKRRASAEKKKNKKRGKGGRKTVEREGGILGRGKTP